MIAVGYLAFSPLLLEAAPPPGDSAEQAREAYRTLCQPCHMPGGNARARRMNLADSVWHHGGKREDLIRTITEGVPGTLMRPFRGKIEAGLIDALADYVISFQAPSDPRPPQSPAVRNRQRRQRALTTEEIQKPQTGGH